MRALLALALCATLPACVAGEAVMQETTRSLARSAVNNAATQYLPGVNVSPYSDCVINHATTNELVSLARVAGAGASGGAQEVATQAWPTVKTIATRPEATQCLVNTLSTSEMLAMGGLAFGG